MGSFFSGPATKALLELSGNSFGGNFFRASKKFFFPSGQALTPPFFAASLSGYPISIQLF